MVTKPNVKNNNFKTSWLHVRLEFTTQRLHNWNSDLGPDLQNKHIEPWENTFDTKLFCISHKSGYSEYFAPTVLSLWLLKLLLKSNLYIPRLNEVLSSHFSPSSSLVRPGCKIQILISFYTDCLVTTAWQSGRRIYSNEGSSRYSTRVFLKVAAFPAVKLKR